MKTKDKKTWSAPQLKKLSVNQTYGGADMNDVESPAGPNYFPS